MIIIVPVLQLLSAPSSLAVPFPPIPAAPYPTERLSEGRKIEGGIVIDDVTVNLTIDNVNVGYGTDIIDDAAGILLKGKAKLNLTVKGENTLKGTYGGAGIGVEEMPP